MDKFEQWFISQDFYTNMRFIHGDALFIKDRDVYRVLPVQMTWVAWQSRQAEVDLLQLELSRAKQVYDNVIEMELKKSRGKDKRIEGLERQLKAVHALARMRSAVITADRWLTLRPHIKKAIQCLDRKEKALRGERE